MAYLKIKVKEKIIISWGTATVSFIRGVLNSVDTSITFNNASGQTFTANQVLYTSGVENTIGYISVKSKDTATLNGSGIFQINVQNYPSSTQTNTSINFDIDGSPTTINFIYNSRPINNDFEVETENRTDYVFTVDDFMNNVSDYDGDSIDQFRINGDVTGYKYDGLDYIAGAWIPKSGIIAGLLIYQPIDQDAYYEKINTWEAMDSQGNISVS